MQLLLLLLLLLPPFRLIPGHLLLLPCVGARRLGKIAIHQLVRVLDGVLHHGGGGGGGSGGGVERVDGFHRDHVRHRLHVLLEIEADIAADAREEIDLLELGVGGLLLRVTVGVGVALRVVVGCAGRRDRLTVAYFGTGLVRQLLCLAYQVDVLHHDILRLKKTMLVSIG